MKSLIRIADSLMGVVSQLQELNKRLNETNNLLAAIAGILSRTRIGAGFAIERNLE